MSLHSSELYKEGIPYLSEINYFINFTFLIVPCEFYFQTHRGRLPTMKYITVLTFCAYAFAIPTSNGGGSASKDQPSVCASDQTVVCSGNGNGGLLSLGNLLTGALGDSCSGGDVYCCSQSDVDEVRQLKTPSRVKNLD